MNKRVIPYKNSTDANSSIIAHAQQCSQCLLLFKKNFFNFAMWYSSKFDVSVPLILVATFSNLSYSSK